MIRDLTEKSVLSVQSVSKEWHGLTLRKPWGRKLNDLLTCFGIGLKTPTNFTFKVS